MIRTIASYFSPQLIESRDSAINGTIRIEQFLGKKRVMVGKYIQSGDYARGVFERGIQGITIKPSRVLVLGVGGGTMIGEVLKRWPSSVVTAVDIDPVMIDIAKKYFGLSSKRVTFVVSDAVAFVKTHAISSHPELPEGREGSRRDSSALSKSLRMTKRFDLIIDDLFVACARPKEADNALYTKNILNHLRKGGIYLCNRSYLPQYKKQTDRAIVLLTKVFPRIDTVLMYPNMIVRGYR